MTLCQQHGKCNCNCILIYKLRPETPSPKPISSSHLRRNKWRLSCWKPPLSATLVQIFQSPLASLPIKHLPAFNFPVQDFSVMALSQIKLLPLLRLGINLLILFIFLNKLYSNLVFLDCASVFIFSSCCHQTLILLCSAGKYEICSGWRLEYFLVRYAVLMNFSISVNIVSLIIWQRFMLRSFYLGILFWNVCNLNYVYLD